MTPLIWMLLWLPAVFPDQGALPMPINVTLTSLNFTYILTWEAGPDTPEGVHYNVTYVPHRDHSWRSVSGCDCVLKPLVCNLTAVFSNVKETYFMTVTAHLGKRVSPVNCSRYYQLGFKPISRLSLPLLSVTPGSRDLRVDLQPPTERFRDIYDILHYELLISSKDMLERVTIQSLRHRWENLAPGRWYCVSVRFNDNNEKLYSNFSQSVCAEIPSTFSAEPLISGFLCLMVIFIVLLIIVLILSGFICLRRRPLPLVLTTIRNLDQVQVHDRCIISSLLSVEPLAPSAGTKRSSRTSSDESDEDGETESTGVSTGGMYTEQEGANPLSSSSSCLSQPKALPDLSSNQLPSSQPDAQISTGSPSGAGLELRADCGAKEEGAQDVNLLTLTFGRVEQEEEEEEEEEEKSDLSVQEVECEPAEDTTEAAYEDEEGGCGYMGRPDVAAQQDDEEQN